MAHMKKASALCNAAEMALLRNALSLIANAAPRAGSVSRYATVEEMAHAALVALRAHDARVRASQRA